MLENHPELFEEAKKYEKFNPITGERYTWNEGESLEELSLRAEAIMEEHAKRKEREANAFKGHQKLKDIWGCDFENEESLSCNICHL